MIFTSAYFLVVSRLHHVNRIPTKLANDSDSFLKATMKCILISEVYISGVKINTSRYLQ